MSSLSLMAYALGLPAFIMIKVLAPGYYARQDTRTPVKIGITAMIANMVMNIAFVVPMVMLDIPGPHTGLALATTGSAYLNAFLLYRGLKKQGIYQPQAGWLRLSLRLLIANLSMALFLIYATPDIKEWDQWLLLDRLAVLLGLITLSIVIYTICLFLSGFRPTQLRSD